MADHDQVPSRHNEMSPAKRALLERWKRGGAEPAAAAIPRAKREGFPHEAPLSSTQQRAWYLDQLVPGSPAYNVSLAIRLTGQLDLAALKYALAELVRRHESLRTTFPTVAGRGKQIIGAPFEPELPLEDLRDVSSDAQPHRLTERLDIEARRILSLERGPLFATRLFRLAEEQHVLQFTIHHIVFDGWSSGVLNRELVTLYAAYAQGKPSPLQELPIQYSDFAAWQQKRVADNGYKTDLDFWKRELAGLTPLSLPTDRPRPAVQSFRGARVELALPRHLTAAIRNVCQREDVTPYMFFLGAFAALLARYSGQDDLAVGSPIANRSRVETEGLIGFFANTIALRTDLSGDPSFRELLGRIRPRTLAAFQHQDLPFEQLVNELSPVRDTSRNPIFQVMMVLQNAPLELLSIPGLEASGGEIHSSTSKFDIWLQWFLLGETWTATFEYATDLFDEATITRMSRHLVRVLESVTTDPEIRLSTIPLLDDDERHRVLVAFNDTAKDYGTERLLHEHIEAQVRRTPERIAVSFDGHELTYAALDERANQLAHYLIDVGVQPDTLVGVHAERSANLVVALLAILKSGGAYVPLDPSYPDERIEHMIRDTAVSVLLTDDGLPARLSARLEGMTAKIVRLDDWTEISRYPSHSPAVSMSMDRLAYVIYTSGSTGLPKGAMNTHRGICNRLLWMQDMYGLSVEDRVLQKTPFSFDVSVWEFFWPLMTGAQLVVARPGGHKDPAYLVETITRERITTMHFVPSMLQAWLEHPQMPQCTSLVRVVCSGEALPAEFRDRFFAKLPGTELHNLYGPTEAAVDVTYWQCRKEDTSETVPIGKPIANTQIYILDDHGQPAPIGVPGELHIGGTNVGRGYLHRPELDAERFVRDPFHARPSAKMYKTGDRARWLPSGDIEFMGRLDSQVKLRGLRIELGEIEHALRQHALITDAAVIVRAAQDASSSSDERKQLAAYVVPTQDTRESMLAAEEHVSQWEGVFDDAYTKGEAPRDPALNLAGWNSSYDGQPIPTEEMLEWVERTVERILETKPRRVLEIGCGTGLLLLRIAPHCEHFLGTDASQRALDYLQPHVADLPNVTLEHRTADRLEGLAAGSFDTIVLNSVAQYFPSEEYLTHVIAGCVSLLQDGGTLFLGDIRDLSRLETFHGSIELANAAPDAQVELVRRRVDRRSFQDNELALSPLFFFELSSQFPRIAGVRVRLKRGRATNELTRFRYDVHLHVGPERPASENVVTLDWSEDELSIGKLVELLSESPGAIHVRRVINRRLASDARQLAALRRAPDGEKLERVLDGARSEGDARDEEPESFFALEARLPYRVDVLWTGFDGPEHFDVILTPANAHHPAAMVPACVLSARDTENATPGARSNNPIHAKLARKLIPDLRRYLGDKLPEFMIPNAFMILDRLPVSPNGKLDRDALPPPIRIVSDAGADDAPRTETERTLAAIWTEVLGLEQVGVESSFFELGGDSIDSIRVVARASDAGLRITPGDIVRYQSIRQLAGVAGTGVAAAVTPPRPLPELPAAARQEIAARAGEIEDAYPFSAYQRELLRHRQSDPPLGLYVLSMGLKLRTRSDAPLDLDAIEAAWQAVAKRYPTFRSSFQWQGLDEPFQVVHRSCALDIERRDISALDPEARTEALNRWLQEGCARGFVLDRPGHVRIGLLQTGPNEVLMGWLYNYMFSDGWSLSFILEDFLVHYDAILQGIPAELPPVIPYRRYVEYQRGLDHAGMEAFWRRTMATYAGVTPLVAALGGKPCPPSQGGVQIRKDRSISAEATAALRALAKNAHLTLSNLVQSAWALILARWTGRARVSFASMMSGRSASLTDYERMAGLFTNPVPTELPISRDRLLLDWVREVQGIQADLYANQHSSLADIRRWSGRSEDTALFETCFIFVKFPLSASGLGARQRTELEVTGGETRTEHPLRVAARAFGPTLDLQFFYYELQLPERQVDELIAATCDLLERLAGFAQTPVEQVLSAIRKDAP